MTRALALVRTPEQDATLDAQARRVNLLSLGFELSGEDCRNAARWQKESPEQFARKVAEALREVAVNRGRPWPWATVYVARAIQLRMEGTDA